MPVPRKVLILGRSHMIDEMLRELDRHLTTEIEVCVAVDGDPEEIESAIDRSTLERLDLRFESLQGDGQRGALERLDIPSYETVFLLADTSAETADPDAGTILTLLLLEDLRKKRGSVSWPRLVAELYDPRNRELLRDTPVDDLIVSPEITSVLITQISELPVLAPVYRELLSAGGIEIGLRPLDAYANSEARLTFRDLVAACQSRFEVALGVLAARGEERVQLNPSKRAEIEVGEADRLIVLAQQRYE